MLLAEQLRRAGIPTFPCWVRYDQNRKRWNKGPAVPKGEAWALTALRPFDDPCLDWSSGVIGVPVPPGVVILDLDTYKGATREAVEHFLGCTLPWDAALIQRTIGGGEHYAFSCQWPTKQGDSLGVPGFDTRSAGRGFICSGQGYTPTGFGVFALAYPERLPALPDNCRHVLERVDAPPPPPRTEPYDVNTDQVIDALKHIDPGCSRAQWFKVGCALRVLFKDDPYEGQQLYERWSSGEWSPAGTPRNYVADGKGSVSDQWPTYKPEGDVQPASLFYLAIQGGWKPPSDFDTASAFGPSSAPSPVFERLVERVLESGGDVKQTGAIIDEIKGSGCNPLQIALLAAELKNALKDTGIKDRAVTGHIDQLLKTNTSTPVGMYGQNDTDNAAIFLSKHYPDGTLIKCDGELYSYTGKIWEKTTTDTLKHQVALDMSYLRMQAAKINTCIDLITKLVPVYEGKINDLNSHKIVFDNGILDIQNGYISPHSKEYLTTILHPYDYVPGAQCPQWLDFLNGTLDQDQERIALLQEWIGYLLVTDYRHHKVMMLLGPKRCGKGTIGRVIQHLVGDANFSGGSLSSFARDSFIDALRTKPVLFMGDAEKKVSSTKINQVIERIKSISGNDAVDFDRKYLSGLSETLPTRITIAANSVPNLFDDSGALASRILVVPFYRSFFGQEDLGLIDRLLTELSGIASWALEGLRRLQSIGHFTEPKASQEEVAYLYEAYSPLMQFLSECCTIGPGTVCGANELYAAYRVWCLTEGEDLLRRKVFISAIKDATRGQGVYYGAQTMPDGTVTKGFKGIAPASPVATTAAAFQPTVIEGAKQQTTN